jgi:3-oxoacyl-[acyl-carrier protein] reductase
MGKVPRMTQEAPRVAIVTGAAQGIGQAVAIRLASDGFDIGVLDQNANGLDKTAHAVEALGRRVAVLTADVTNSSEVEDMVHFCVSILGPLDVLVCCAGVLRDAPFLDMTDDEWSLVLAVNLSGAFFCARAAARYMVERHTGKIVLVSSTSAQGNLDQANYSAAKAGIEGLTKALSLELGPYNVNVNAVAPGFTVTQMTRDLAVKRGMKFDDLVASAAESIPLRRVAQPSDMANVIAFLAGEDSSFVTGQIVYATGGARGSTARTPKS